MGVPPPNLSGSTRFMMPKSSRMLFWTGVPAAAEEAGGVHRVATAGGCSSRGGRWRAQGCNSRGVQQQRSLRHAEGVSLRRWDGTRQLASRRSSAQLAGAAGAEMAAATAAAAAGACTSTSAPLPAHPPPPTHPPVSSSSQPIFRSATAARVDDCVLFMRWASSMITVSQPTDCGDSGRNWLDSVGGK